MASSIFKKLFLIYLSRCKSLSFLQGYHGVLCGACDITHGKIRFGECQKCWGKAINIVAVSSLVFLLTFLAAILMKNALSTTLYQTNNTGCSGSTFRVHVNYSIADDVSMGQHETCGDSKTDHSRSVVDCERHLSSSNRRERKEKTYTPEIFKVMLLQCTSNY